MKNLLLINDSVTNKISYYHLAGFLITLPFDSFYSQLIIISFAIHTVINLQRNRFHLVINKFFLIPVALYIISVLSIFYSTDKSEGLNIIGRQAAIFFMPLLLALNPINLTKHKMQLLEIFALTSTLIVVYLYADAIHTIVFFKLPIATLFTTAFINHNFSLPIEMHATYLSMYLALAVFIFIFLFFQQNNIYKKILYSCYLLLLLAGIFQLSSRAVFAAILLIVPIGISIFFLQGKKRIGFLFIAIVLVLCTSFIIVKVDAFKQRYVSELKNDLAQKEINNEILEPRMARWELAFNLIKASPLIGYGNGSEMELLQQQYFNHKLYIAYLQQFNVHSQYLSYLLKGGLIALAIYLFVIGFGFSIALQEKDFLFFSFLAVIAIASVAENILEVNKGIFFYSFFLSFFLISNKPDIFYAGNRKTI